MTKQKIAIKRIDNIAARQTTFSKRRRGLFKKAEELSTLCDAELALLVFSPSDKLFDYASPSMHQILERYDLHTSVERTQNPQELQLTRNSYNMARKELEDKTREQRHWYGEDLEGLKVHELMKLEKNLSKGLSRVSKAKDGLIRKDINELKRKGVELAEDNRRLKQIQSGGKDQGQPSNPTMICCSGPSNRSQHPDAPNACLNLGLATFK